jgi:plastocyanin
MARNKRPEAKRDPSLGLGGVGDVGGFGGVGGVGGFGGVGGVGVAAVGVAPIIGFAPIVGVSPVILLYTNQGGGAANQVVSPQVTVTQTVQVPAGGQPTAVAGVDGVTQTIQPGSTGTMVMAGATHTVTVGGDLGRAFFPADIQANPGDTILFNFMSQNHTVTQSGFDTPCVPLAGGMDSGFMANPDNTIDPPPQVAMQLTTTDPLWMYCAQGDHCSVGMVLSINPTLEKTHAQFQANAIALGTNPATAITGGGAGGAAPVANDPAVADPNVANPPLDLPNPNNVVSDPLNPSQLPNTPATASVATGALNGGLVMGLGTVNPDGSCSCAIQCDSSVGAAAAGVPQDVGLGGFGGQVGKFLLLKSFRRRCHANRRSAVIPMGAAGIGAQSVGVNSVGVNSVGVNSVGVNSVGAQSVGVASIDPLGASSVGAASIAPLGAATVDPLAAATVDPLAAGAATGLVAPDPAIVGRGI